MANQRCRNCEGLIPPGGQDICGSCGGWVCAGCREQHDAEEAELRANAANCPYPATCCGKGPYAD